jgi:hypothetical protein
VRKLAIAIVVALALIGVAFAVVPFDSPGIDYGAWHTSGFGKCSAPVVSAFKSDGDHGWFGYAPLTSTPTRMRFPTCHSDGQRRLQYGGMFLLAALVIAVAIRKAGTEDGGTPPNPAVA